MYLLPAACTFCAPFQNIPFARPLTAAGAAKQVLLQLGPPHATVATVALCALLQTFALSWAPHLKPAVHACQQMLGGLAHGWAQAQLFTCFLMSSQEDLQYNSSTTTHAECSMLLLEGQVS
jgi:hypothetical protein